MLLNVETIEGSRPGPHLLITAGVHGDEWEPMVAARELAMQIQPNALAGRLTIVPIVNESAYRLGQRVGEDGMDLARVCPGRPEGCMTERIAHELSELMRDVDYFIDLHTGGIKMQIWPLAGYIVHPNKSVLERQRQMARAFGLPVVWGTDPTIEGRTLSVARDRSIPTIYVEYLGSASFCRSAVDALVNGCRNVMAAIKMLSGPELPNTVRFSVEDRRPGSGHLQICHPAPADGLFEPVAELGSELVTGAQVGYFTRDGSTKRVVIAAESSGRLVAIRSLPRVTLGEGLAVIVNLTEMI